MFTANVTQKHMMQMMYDDEVNNILALSCVFEFLTTMISTVFSRVIATVKTVTTQHLCELE